MIEAAIDSIAAAEHAVREGADRLEVCARLDVGGLTPTVDVLSASLTLGVPCVAMLRPRPGDFVYTSQEVTDMRSAAGELFALGAHGIVFGVLNPDGAIDAEGVRSIMARCSGREAVFHRAFDATPDAIAALDVLIACGITRVLTSGHAASAPAGAQMLGRLQTHSAGRVEILAGGGVRAPNVEELVRHSGVTQIHARATEPGVIAALRSALEGRGPRAAGTTP